MLGTRILEPIVVVVAQIPQITRFDRSGEQRHLQVLEDGNALQVDPNSSFRKHRVDYLEHPLQVNAPLVGRPLSSTRPPSFRVARPSYGFGDLASPFRRS